MTIAELREELEQVRELVLHGDRDGALGTLDHALRELDAERLLTTTEAASFLGVRSVNTLKLLLRQERIATVQHGNRAMVPLGELERLRDSERVRGLRASDRRHDAAEALGGEALSEAELVDLEAGRPGTLPWGR